MSTTKDLLSSPSSSSEHNNSESQFSPTYEYVQSGDCYIPDLLLSPSTPIHHMMQTRSKNGHSKPKHFPPKFQLYTVTVPQHITREPQDVQTALSDPNWKMAVQAKYSALMKNGTWISVPCTSDKKVISCKWVFRVKYKVDGSLDKYKACLVTKRFQQTPFLDFSTTYSLVVKSATIQVVMTLAVTHG